MKFFKVDTIEQAREKIKAHVKSWIPRSEKLPLGETQNRILADNVFASCDIPSFSRSTVDGYAVKACDTSGAGETIPVNLKNKGSVSMGKPAGFSIGPGECAYVPTGGMLPDGADAMVMIEYTEQLEDNNDNVAIYEAVAAGMRIIEKGEDFLNGELLLKSGTRIRAQEIGALSAAGITDVRVFSMPVIGIISTGDELVAPECEPKLGEIRDINSGTVKALAEKHGFNIMSTKVLPDDEEQLINAVNELMVSCDIVIISGGSSQGLRDITAKIMERAANPGIFTHGLAVKPGKPTLLGWDEKSKTLLVGLPGNPVSAMMVFELLIGSVDKNELFQIPNISFPVPDSLSARISCNVPGSPGKVVCLPVSLTLINGQYSAQPMFGKAGIISTLTNADGYTIIDKNKEGLKKDEIILVRIF
ncbi:MAG: molybdopterin-binding protein [Treponema sp.]|nr:molybdopterin-binding protein [Treponema sp.]